MPESTEGDVDDAVPLDSSVGRVFACGDCRLDESDGVDSFDQALIDGRLDDVLCDRHFAAFERATAEYRAQKEAAGRD